MDNPTAKEILAAYRSHGQDALDPNFKEALRQLKSDPELAQWAEAEKAFDREAARALGRIHGPACGKSSILGTAQFDQSSRPHPPTVSHFIWYLGAGIAAAFAVGFFLIASKQGLPEQETIAEAEPAPLSKPSIEVEPRPAPPGIEAGENFLLSSFAALAAPLMQFSDDYDGLTEWLADNNGPTPEALPSFFDGNLIGCTVFDDGFGGKLAVLCFSVNDALVHVFVMEPQVQERLNVPLNEWWGEHDWMLYAWESGPQKLALATLSDPMPIDALLRRGG